MSRSLVGSRGGSRSPSPDGGPARKISAPAYYASPSYITIENSKTRKSSFRKFGVQKESQPDKHIYDPSLLFARCPGKDRDSRSKSEGPLSAPILNGVGNGHGTGDESDAEGGSRKTSRVQKKSVANMFLPNNNEEPVMVIKKHSKDMSRKSSFDSGVGLEGDDEKKRKKSGVKMTTSDKHEQAKIIAELCQRLAYIDEKMKGLEKESERIQQEQRTSNDFQIQVMKQSDAPDLEKGVTKVLDMVQFDRKQELTRLIKKADDFKRRSQRGVKLDGDDEELRDMQIAAQDLEKKIMKGFDEITRLQIKTENVVTRQREQEKVQKAKREKFAMGNSTMRVLISDAKTIDSILSEVREFQNTEQKEGEKCVQEFFTLMGEECMDQIKEDIAKIEEYKTTSEMLKEEVWEDRLESNRIQTAVVDEDPDVNIEEATEILRERITIRKKKTKEIKQEYEEFLLDQKKRYDVLLKTKREEAEKLQLKKKAEEEEKKRKEAEEQERMRLLKIAQEKERKRKEEEARLKAIADAEEKKKKDEDNARLKEIAMIKQEINNTLKKEQKNMQLMRKEAERVEVKQREVEMIVEKRQEVNIGGDLKNINFLESMHHEFTTFSESMQEREDTIVKIGRLVMDPSQDVKALQKMSEELTGGIEVDWKKLESIGRDSDNRHTTQQKLLTAQLLEIKRREDEAREAARRAQEEMEAATDEIERMRLAALEQERLLAEQERLRRLREEEEAANMLEQERLKRMMDEADRLKRLEEEEAERLRRLAEEEDSKRMREKLDDLNDGLRIATVELAVIQEEWRDFDWDDKPWDGEYAGEMLGCLANPAFLYGIRDPKKIIEILQRAARMKELRAKLKADAEKMAYICSAISKMIIAAKEAEERRWARQNTEWVKDAPVYSPADNISSAHDVSFGSSASRMSVEENKRLMAERKVSRQNMAPETMKELAKHSGYDMEELEGGYGGWSRKRLGQNETKKSSSSTASSSLSRGRKDKYL